MILCDHGQKISGGEDNFLIYGTNMFSTMKLIRLDKILKND